MEVDYNKVVVLLRATSGSGKSTLAQYLTILYPGAVVCCADDFFTKNGAYEFDVQKLGAAHDWCRAKFRESLESNNPLVVIANTSTSEKEIAYYIDLAAKYNYTLFSLVLENRHGNSDVHSVPEETLVRQENKLKSSLKLR